MTRWSEFRIVAQGETPCNYMGAVNLDTASHIAPHTGDRDYTLILIPGGVLVVEGKYKDVIARLAEQPLCAPRRL